MSAARHSPDDDDVVITGVSVDQQKRANFHEARAAVKKEHVESAKEDVEFAQDQAFDVATMQDGERYIQQLTFELLQKCIDEQRLPLQEELNGLKEMSWKDAAEAKRRAAAPIAMSVAAPPAAAPKQPALAPRAKSASKRPMPAAAELVAAAADAAQDAQRRPRRGAAEKPSWPLLKASDFPEGCELLLPREGHHEDFTWLPVVKQNVREGFVEVRMPVEEDEEPEPDARVFFSDSSKIYRAMHAKYAGSLGNVRRFPGIAVDQPSTKRAKAAESTGAAAPPTLAAPPALLSLAPAPAPAQPSTAAPPTPLETAPPVPVVPLVLAPPIVPSAPAPPARAPAPSPPTAPAPAGVWHVRLGGDFKSYEEATTQRLLEQAFTNGDFERSLSVRIQVRGEEYFVHRKAADSYEQSAVNDPSRTRPVRRVMPAVASVPVAAALPLAATPPAAVLPSPASSVLLPAAASSSGGLHPAAATPATAPVTSYTGASRSHRGWWLLQQQLSLQDPSAEEYKTKPSDVPGTRTISTFELLNKTGVCPVLAHFFWENCSSGNGPVNQDNIFVGLCAAFTFEELMTAPRDRQCVAGERNASYNVVQPTDRYANGEYKYGSGGIYEDRGVDPRRAGQLKRYSAKVATVIKQAAIGAGLAPTLAARMQDLLANVAEHPRSQGKLSLQWLRDLEEEDRRRHLQDILLVKGDSKPTNHLLAFLKVEWDGNEGGLR